MDDDDDLALALRLADIADELSMGQFRSDHASHTRKAGGGVVTEADTAIERALREELGRRRPGDAVYGEEYGGSRTGDRVWMLDPIDGTAWFIEGSDEWATLIGLMENGTPTVGVVSRPAASTRWWAASGCGAYRNGTRIRVSKTRLLDDAVIADDFRSSAFRKLDTNPVAAVAAMSAAVRPWRDKFIFLDVATGVVDVAVHWWSGSGPDLAGQVCILHEAGGRFSDLDGNVNIDADVHVLSNRYLHDAIIEAARAVIHSAGLDPGQAPDEDVPAIWAARAEHGHDHWRPHEETAET